MPQEEPSVVISLTVNDVATALEFYATAFGAKELVRMPTPDGTVVHAEFMIGNTLLYISCESPEWNAHTLPEGTCAPCLFGINVESPDESFEKAIAAGATAIDPPQTQFWGMRTAIIADPFGYRWNLRQLVEELSNEEIMLRAQQMMSQQQ